MARGAHRRGHRRVQGTPEIREEVRRAVDTLLEGTDEEVEPALKELWQLLDDYPGLRERFARLQVVADAVDFLKDRTNPRPLG